MQLRLANLQPARKRPPGEALEEMHARVGRHQLREVLLEAGERGAEVRLLADAIGLKQHLVIAVQRGEVEHALARLDAHDLGAFGLERSGEFFKEDRPLLGIDGRVVKMPDGWQNLGWVGNALRPVAPEYSTPTGYVYPQLRENSAAFHVLQSGIYPIQGMRGVIAGVSISTFLSERAVWSTAYRFN